MQLLGNSYGLIDSYYIEDDELERLLRSTYEGLLQKRS